MMSKFPGSDHSCRRRYVAKLLAGRRNKNEIYICEAVCGAVRKKPREQSSRTVTWQSADFQTTFFRPSNQVGGDSTVDRLSNNCFPKYQARLKEFLKKVAERSRDSGWGHATVGRLSNNVFSTFQANRKIFEKSRWTVTWTCTEVTRLSANCQTTFLDVSSN